MLKGFLGYKKIIDGKISYLIKDDESPLDIKEIFKYTLNEHVSCYGDVCKKFGFSHTTQLKRILTRKEYCDTSNVNFKCNPIVDLETYKKVQYKIGFWGNNKNSNFLLAGLLICTEKCKTPITSKGRLCVVHKKLRYKKGKALSNKHPYIKYIIMNEYRTHNSKLASKMKFSPIPAASIENAVLQIIINNNDVCLKDNDSVKLQEYQNSILDNYGHSSDEKLYNLIMNDNITVTDCRNIIMVYYKYFIIVDSVTIFPVKLI